MVGLAEFEESLDKMLLGTRQAALTTPRSDASSPTTRAVMRSSRA